MDAGALQPSTAISLKCDERRANITNPSGNNITPSGVHCLTSFAACRLVALHTPCTVCAMDASAEDFCENISYVWYKPNLGGYKTYAHIHYLLTIMINLLQILNKYNDESKNRQNKVTEIRCK